MSLLPPLEPIGLGTPEVESLSSYTQRIASAQGILPGQLVFRVMTWLDVGRPEMIGNWAERPRRVRIGHNNNSFTHALVWLRLLQRLTGRADLEQLTTVSWDHNFPARSFQRNHLAWCPGCLGEDAEPYHRLSWMLQPVKGCVRHQVALRSSCPRCHRRLPVVHDRSTVLMCPFCRGNLRLVTGGEPQGVPSEFDLWSAEEVGKIIAASAEWHRPLKWDSATALKTLCKETGFKNAAEFARFLGTSRITCWYWLTGATQPSLPMALRAYHHAGASLAVVLAGRKRGPEPRAERQPEMYLRRTWKPVTRDWPKIGRLLEAELTRLPQESLPLTEIARRHGADPRVLRLHFPRLCLKLTARHKKRCRIEAEQRYASLKKRIAAAIAGLAHRGWEISRRSVAQELAQPGLFSKPRARRAYDEAFAVSWRSNGAPRAT
jgi:hypothetical protein